MFRHQSFLKHVVLWHLLLLVGTAQSQSQANSSSPVYKAITTSLVFAPWDADLSVIAVDSAATTYLENNHDPSRNNSNTQQCDAEAYDRVTIVNGPSIAGATFVFTECGTNPAYIYNVDCPLSEPNTATCHFGHTRGNSTQTTTVTQNSSELSPQPCTITAGIEKLSIRSATMSTTSDSKPPAAQTTFPSATSPTSLAPNSSSTPSEGSYSRARIRQNGIASIVAITFLIHL